MKIFRFKQKPVIAENLHGPLPDRPFTALYLASLEIMHCGECAAALTAALRQHLQEEAAARTTSLQKSCLHAMALAEEIDTYLDRLHLSGMLNKEQTVCASMMQVILHALQRIFIECEKTRVRLAAAYKSKYKFSPNDLSEIDRGLALAEKIITRSMASVIKGDSKKTAAALVHISMIRDQLELFATLHKERTTETAVSRSTAENYDFMMHTLGEIITDSADIAETASYGLSFSDLKALGMTSGALHAQKPAPCMHKQPARISQVES